MLRKSLLYTNSTEVLKGLSQEQMKQMFSIIGNTLKDLQCCGPVSLSKGQTPQNF